MKKAISLLLALMLCLSLCACGGEKDPVLQKDPVAEKEEMIVGEWKTLDGHTVIFNEDKTGTAADGNDMTWKYDVETDCYLLSMTFSGEIRTWKCEYKNEEGIRSLSIGDSIVYHADDYEKAVEANK